MLESFPEGTVRAAHPTSIRGSTLALVIAGLQVHRDTRLLGLPMPNKPISPIQMEAFSQAEAEFLAPLIAIALSRATPDQIVRFHVFRKNTEGRDNWRCSVREEPLPLRHLDPISSQAWYRPDGQQA